MGWDSNPRWAFAHAGFQDRCLKPLGHPSIMLDRLRFASPSELERWTLLPKLLPHAFHRAPSNPILAPRNAASLEDCGGEAGGPPLGGEMARNLGAARE